MVDVSFNEVLKMKNGLYFTQKPKDLFGQSNMEFLLVWLICVLACLSLGLTLWDFLHFPNAGEYFLFHVREVFDDNHLKYFLRPILFLFFWNPYNSTFWDSNVGVCNIPEVSKAFPFLFILFILFSLFGSIAIFPPSYLPAQSSILLPQLVYYWFLLVYFLFLLFFCWSLIVL